MSGAKFGTYLTELKVSNVKSFKDDHVLSLCDAEGRLARWTLLLGDNGVGKTTLLQCIAHLAPFRNTTDADGTKNPTFFIEPTGASEVQNFEPLARHGTHRVYLAATFAAKGVFGTPPDKRQGLFTNWVDFDRRGTKTERFEASKELDVMKKDPLIIAYGAGRKLGRANVDASSTMPALASLFDEVELIDAEDLIQQLDYAALRRSTTKSKRQNAVMKSMIAALLPNVDTADNIKVYGPSPLTAKQKVGVHVRTPYGEVPLNALSFGYQTMTAWLADIGYRLFRHYPDSANPLLQPAIILVDEIDLHLHPRWQRQLRQRLTEHFPAVQFIATAHSPLMAQAYISENLAVVRREDDHAVIVNEPDAVKGWRLDQVITSELFGLDSAYSPDVEALLQEQRNLRANRERTPAEDHRLADVEVQLVALPQASDPDDDRAMAIIRRAAARLERNGSDA